MTSLFERCHELFIYEDGVLYRKSSSGGCKKNSIVGFDHVCKKDIYRRLKIDGRSYMLHRIVFLMFNNILPDLVDHIDGNTMNNRIENLRASCKKTNRWNCNGNKGSQSGIKGVYLDRGRWKALVNVAGVRYYLGMYDTKELAKKVVDAKYLELQKEFALQHRALIPNNNCTSFDYTQEIDETGLETEDNKSEH